MAHRTLFSILILAFILIQPISEASAVDPQEHQLVRDDAFAQEIVVRLRQRDTTRVIDVRGKHRHVNPVTGHAYTLLKVRFGAEDMTCAINEATGTFATDRGLPEREARELLARLPAVYQKMGPLFLARVREAQGGRLGSDMGMKSPIEVTFYADSAGDLDAIAAALGEASHQRFDAPFLFSEAPPVLRPSKDGTTPLAAAVPPIRAITAVLPLREVLRIGALGAVRWMEEGAKYSVNLAVAVPRVNGNTVKGFGLQGVTADIGVIDTGVDNTHPDLDVGAIDLVTAEMDFSGDAQYCVQGANNGTVCNCGPVPAGACVAGFCAGGPLPGAACVAACAAPGVCEGPEDDRTGHGSHVTGIAVNRSAGNPGMATLADVISAKALGGVLVPNDPILQSAVIWARGQGADVLNLSLGRQPAMSNGQVALARQLDFETFVNNVTVVVAAAETPNQAAPSTPADAFNILAVGASNLAGPPSTEATFQIPGPTTDGRSKPDVIAPGQSPGADGIDSTAHDWEEGVAGANPDFRDLEGTSMSSPLVAGLAAMLWDWGGANGILRDTPYLKAAILNTANRLALWARPATDQPLDTLQGTGEIDALAAFKAYSDDLRVWQQRVTGIAVEDSHWYSVEHKATGDLVTTLVFERHVTNPAVAAAPQLNDLDLFLWDADANIVARSDSAVDSVEHIVRLGAAAGHYCIEVDPIDLSQDNAELYALAANPSRLQFLGTTFPCIPDFGDAPDPAYPTLAASNGARHRDWTKEWLGTSRPEIDGELQKSTLAVMSMVDPFPSVSGETDADDFFDQDGVENLTDADGWDDGVILPVNWSPIDLVTITITVQTTVDDTGISASGRYDSTVAAKRLYLNGWADWNGNGDWTDPGEKIVGTGSPTGTVAIDPQTFGPNGRFTIGEAFTDTNGSGQWEPGESFTDTVGKTEASFDYAVATPLLMAPSFYLRFRIDYGEDVGNVANTSGNLAEEKGLAQNGEVEDYKAQLARVVWDFFGTALGGSVSATILGEEITVPTTAGESAATVAANFASAVNANTVLANLGVFAQNDQARVLIFGVTHRQVTTDINDPGIKHVNVLIPALWPRELMVLGALLLAAMYVAIRRWSPSTPT